MKKIILCILILLTLSCNKKSEISKNEKKETGTSIVPVEIIKNGNISNEKNDDKNLNNNTKDNEFEGMVKKAEKGDKNSILNLYLYSLSINDKNRIKKYEKLGLKYNVEKIIKLKLSDMLKREDFICAEKLVDKLSDKKEKLNLKKNILYNIAVEYSNKNKKNLAIKKYIEAYKIGMTDVDITIAYEYLKENNIKEAIKWFVISDKNGNKEANYELAQIYYKNKQYDKALEHLKIQYNRGNKELAISIGVCYVKLNDFENAYKWFNIAKNNGNKEADSFIKEIKLNRKGSYIVE